MSIPYLSGHPFLRVVEKATVNPVSIVSIPYLSGHPFLPLWSYLYWHLLLVCVNPLSIGTPISTHFHKELRALSHIVCQSPIYRDTHFYMKNEYIVVTGCVNPLSIGTPISTFAAPEPKMENPRIVSIPYLSGHPFLLSINCMDSTRQIPCQSPIYRDTHFYSPGRRKTSRKHSEMCQSPIYRDTHFYRCFLRAMLRTYWCVNPLSIGTPISTLTLKIY